MKLAISTKRFAWIQYTIVISLLLTSTVMYLIRHFTGHQNIYGLFRFFNVGSEANLPTYFSALNLLLASCLLALVAGYKHAESPKLAQYWIVLAWMFLYMSIDESAKIHDYFGRLYRAVGEPIPVFDSHHWLPIGIALSILVAAFFVPFLLKIPRALALRLILAGVIFLTGAIGFEFVGALMLYTEYAVRGDLIYDLRRIGEEGCEMIGIAYFNVVLVRELTGTQLELAIERG
ncbi:MAG: hypothetical protein ACR2QW_00835 [bacterium]